MVQLGQYPTAQSFQMDNDQVSSIRVGASVKATLFQDNWYGGRSEVIYFDAPRLTNNLIGNDALSSIIVEPNGWSACTSPPPYPYTQYLPAAYCRREPLAEEVIVYRDAYFGGDCAINRPGNYEHGSSFSMPNDSVSSIKVGSGVKATLYSDAYFNGREQTLSAPGSDRLSIQFIGNDTASSLKVRRTCN